MVKLRFINSAILALGLITPSLAADSPEKVKPALEPLVSLYKSKRFDELRALHQQMKDGNKLNPTAALYAEILVNNLDQKPKLGEPKDVPKDVSSAILADCVWSEAKTEYLNPSRNINSIGFFETAEGLHRNGLYAHANCVYEFDLGGKWESLKGTGALSVSMAPYTSVDFIIEVDGERVLSRRRAHSNSKPIEVNVNLRGAKTLKLITTDAGDGKTGDGAYWVDLKLSRPRRLR